MKEQPNMTKRHVSIPELELNASDINDQEVMIFTLHPSLLTTNSKFSTTIDLEIDGETDPLSNFTPVVKNGKSELSTGLEECYKILGSKSDTTSKVSELLDEIINIPINVTPENSPVNTRSKMSEVYTELFMMSGNKEPIVKNYEPNSTKKATPKLESWESICNLLAYSKNPEISDQDFSKNLEVLKQLERETFGEAIQTDD